jgi:hypothetical protein
MLSIYVIEKIRESFNCQIFNVNESTKWRCIIIHVDQKYGTLKLSLGFSLFNSPNHQLVQILV